MTDILPDAASLRGDTWRMPVSPDDVAAEFAGITANLSAAEHAGRVALLQQDRPDVRAYGGARNIVRKYLNPDGTVWELSAMALEVTVFDGGRYLSEELLVNGGNRRGFNNDALTGPGAEAQSLKTVVDRHPYYPAGHFLG